MGSFRVFSQRTGRMATLAALVVATLGQGLLPALASADAITSRSVQLSSSSKGATGVSYKISFTTTNAAGAYVVEFCKNSPIIPSACTAPTDFTAASAALGADGTTATAVTGSTNKLVVTNVMTAGESVTDTFTGITNPSTTDPLYARIVTYDNATSAGAYTSADLKTGVQDQGSAAIAITETVEVSGVVQESMIFCTASEAISANCGDASSHSPKLTLGNANGALDSADKYTGDLYTQISTNAANGAVVSLKSDASQCGGLHRLGDAYDTNHCFIKPADADNNVAAATPYFGVKTSADDVDPTNGTFQAANGYNDTTYLMNFDSTHPTAPTSGVTSTYGDEILNTAGAPANNRNMTLTFGASVSNNTPAGTYQAKLSLIATGTF